jgi:hypothetical protein
MKKKKYCKKCGLKLTTTRHDNGFDEFTGEALFCERKFCPKIESFTKNFPITHFHGTFMGHTVA